MVSHHNSSLTIHPSFCPVPSYVDKIVGRMKCSSFAYLELERPDAIGAPTILLFHTSSFIIHPSPFIPHTSRPHKHRGHRRSGDGLVSNVARHPSSLAQGCGQ